MLLIRRVTAYLVDIVLLFLVLAPVGFLVRTAMGWPGPSATGQEVWLASALHFSLPTWTYFVVADSWARGTTLGKQLLRVHVTALTGGRVGGARALARTAVKLLPWELAHFSAFALSTDLIQFAPSQGIGLSLANGLAMVYLVVAAGTSGRRSVHDYVVATELCLGARKAPSQQR